MQRFVGRLLSTRKDSERFKLLKFDKNLMKSTSKILLISDESKKLGEMSPQEARKLGEEKGMEVIVLSKGAEAKDHMLTCKLFSKLQLQEAEKQLRLKSHHKTIELRSNIDEHDLQIKIKKIRQLLEKGNSVCLSVFHKQVRWGMTKPNGKELQRNLINRVCSELNITNAKTTVAKSNVITCILKSNQLTDK